MPGKYPIVVNARFHQAALSSHAYPRFLLDSPAPIMLACATLNPLSPMKRTALFLSLLPALLATVPAQAASAGSAAPLADAALLTSLPHRSNSVYSVLEAAAAGDVVALEARLAEGENPSQVDETGSSPLHYAARARSARALELLIAAGADPAARDACGRTPRQICRHAAFIPILHRAEMARERELALCALITRADEAGVRAALAEGLNPNARSADNEGTLLLYAVSLGHVAVVKVLLEAGANVDAVTMEGQLSSLHIAAATGDIDVLRVLLEAGANPMLQSANGAYPLHDAIWGKHLEAVRTLLPAYAGINFSPKGGPHGSPLAMAISYDRVDCMRAFLEAGFNPNDERLKAEPPLILAASSGSKRCLRLLLEAGADRQMRDTRGKTALDYASADIAPLLR